MNTIKIAIIAIIAAASLSACDEETKSVQYYGAHRDEIAPELAKCQKEAGLKNCEAAATADAIIKQQAWLATPPKRGVW